MQQFYGFQFDKINLGYSKIKPKQEGLILDAVIVFTTTPTFKDAEKISSVLVEEKLAACVSIIGEATSTFNWEGKIEKEKEYVLMIKTRKSLFNKVLDRIKKLHPYKVPEIIASEVIFGNPEYLKWIEETTKEG